MGDNWEVDVVGALHAGLWAVWLNRQGFPVPEASSTVPVVQAPA
ncbi:MAG: hypothetical protein QME79_04025 [Bacillota bacterium]|nr:hypothetical protein [Bacillota bacterium]